MFLLLVCFKEDKILFPADSQSGFIVKLMVKHLFGECYKLKKLIENFLHLFLKAGMISFKGFFKKYLN